MTTQSEEKEMLRMLRRALNEMRMQLNWTGESHDAAKQVQSFIDYKLAYLKSDPEAYQADQIGELSTMAQVLLVAIYPALSRCIDQVES